MKVLVTGAAGFIGSHLAEHLADLGHEVIGVDCFTDYYSTRLKKINAEDVKAKGVPVLRLDLAEDDLTSAVQGVQFIYHSAAQPGISAKVPFETYVRNNIMATYRLLEAVKNASSLKLFVNIATSSIYGYYATEKEDATPKPTSFYGVTKLAAEQLALSYYREYGLPALSLRLFSVYGERERPDKLFPKLIESILEDREFPLYEGSEDHSRAFTYVGDAIKGLLLILRNMDTCVGEIINIGSDKEVKTVEAMRTVESILGKKAKFVSKPQRVGDQLQTCANINKARRILGYEPETRIEEGLRSEVEWYTQSLG